MGISVVFYNIQKLAILFLSALAANISGTAMAAPEEVQVYMDEMNAPGHFSLDTHLNYVPSGTLTDDYPGEEQSLHRLRLTPEFAYGITPNLEAGLYLPLATLDAQGHLGLEGVKTRIKFIAPRAEGQNWWWGANFELGRVSRRLDINPWNAELKGIVGVRIGKWTLAENANIDFVVSGPEPSPAQLDFDKKVDYALSKSVAIGLESYNGVGSFTHFGQFGSSEQSIFAVTDLSLGHWALNLGVGRGYGTNPDRTIVKAIVSVPLERIMGRRNAIG
jgi:hypothetical protein